MNEAAIKTELHDRIEHADERQIKEIYGLVLNYFNGQDDHEEWDSLSEAEQQIILKSLDEADAGLVTPFDEATRQIKAKYGLK
ncbi:MAG TPA: hypothetical protein VIQ77_10285 [Mucilaginibacter sp.]